jgi:hypothetical protein
MDVISAYREVGSYRGAAVVCRTTPKTVKRIICRHEAGDGPPARKDRGHNYDPVTEAGRGADPGHVGADLGEAAAAGGLVEHGVTNLLTP